MHYRRSGEDGDLAFILSPLTSSVNYEYEPEFKIETKHDSGDSSDSPAIPSSENNESNTCVVCWERESNAILLECGHSGICVECAGKLWDDSRLCPLCRQGFAGVMRITSCTSSTVPDDHLASHASSFSSYYLFA
jgi:hypothetical protein